MSLKMCYLPCIFFRFFFFLSFFPFFKCKIMNTRQENAHRKSIIRVVINRSMMSSFMFFIYTSFIHISFILNNSVARLLPSFFFFFFMFFFFHFAFAFCIRVSLCRRCAFIEFIALIKRSFATLSLTYYRYYRYHYRKNKSLNNHIRVVEPSRIVGKRRAGKKRERVCIRTYMHAYVYFADTHM